MLIGFPTANLFQEKHRTPVDSVIPLSGTWGNETKGVTLTKKRPTLTKLNRLVSLTTYLL